MNSTNVATITGDNYVDIQRQRDEKVPSSTSEVAFAIRRAGDAEGGFHVNLVLSVTKGEWEIICCDDTLISTVLAPVST